jgi:DNA-binding NarL/FixJ family response regulator
LWRGREWRDCVEQVSRLNPDLVILDLQMPVMNGLEAAQRISLMAPHTMMVLFTVHDSAQLLQDARRAGIKFLFSKSGAGPKEFMNWLNALSISQ